MSVAEAAMDDDFLSYLHPALAKPTEVDDVDDEQEKVDQTETSIWLSSSTEHHPHTLDDRHVDIRQRVVREEKHVPHDVVAPSTIAAATPTASSLFDFDPPDSTSDNNDMWTIR